MSIKLSDNFGTNQDYHNTISYYKVPDIKINKDIFDHYIKNHKKKVEKTRKAHNSNKIKIKSNKLSEIQRNRLATKISVYEKSKELTYTEKIPNIFSHTMSSSPPPDLHEQLHTLENTQLQETLKNAKMTVFSQMISYSEENPITFDVILLRGKRIVVDIPRHNEYLHKIVQYYTNNTNIDDLIYYEDRDKKKTLSATTLRDPNFNVTDQELMKPTMNVRKTINRDNLQYKKRKYQTLKTATTIPNEINKMVCNKANTYLHGQASCFPDFVINEIRDAYNLSRNDASKHITTNNIAKIIRQLYFIFQCETEESFLSILSEEKRKKYTYAYFAPALLRNEKNENADGTSINQFPTFLNQYEDFYQDYANITYNCKNDIFHTIFDCHIRFHDKYREDYLTVINRLTKEDLIHECADSHMELIRILHFFMKLDHINQISIVITHSVHAQSIYINKKEKIFYNFDSSHFHSLYHYKDLNNLNTSIRREIGSLLISYSNKYVLKRNKKQQYLEGVCGLHVILFIMTMIDHTLTMKQKIQIMNREIDNDDDVRRKVYNYLNPNMINQVIKKTSYIS
jgi:hypothetical protein